MGNFDWDYFHTHCNLNEIASEIMEKHSRFYTHRFSNIIFMIEKEFYYEDLLNMMILWEQIVATKTSMVNYKFEKLINISYKGEKNTMAHLFRQLRNVMAHKFLFKYYLVFDGYSTEFPLDEESNYRHIIFKLLLPLIGLISNKIEDTVSFSIGEYCITDLAKQYGINKQDLDSMLNEGIVKNMKTEEKLIILKRNELKIMERLNKESPVFMWESILRPFFEPK
ncbi:MAG: hypothetical protein WC968_00785 [Bacilli bacterium]